MTPRVLASGGRDPLLAAILIVALALNVYHLQWGLPDGGQSAWAADSYGPLKVFGIAYRSFSRWDSGWYYFKHPLGYPLLLAAAYAPYLAYLRAIGLWEHPGPKYPYGFADPEGAFYTLAIVGRVVSVLFTLGIVALVYCIGKRLAGRDAGRLAAWFVATAYPFVFYAHTTNLDPAYLFWLSLALYAAICASETERPAPWGWLGCAAAMAVATREQGAGFLLPLPLLALAFRVRAVNNLRPLWSKPVWWMAGTALATTMVANNIIYNPRGFIGRVAFMLGRPLEPVSRALLPVEFSWFKGAREWLYLQQTWDTIDDALGTPLAVVALLGAVALWRRPRAAVWLLAPALCMYYFGLRGLLISASESTLVVTVRYALPVVLVVAMAAAMLLAQLREYARTRSARVAVSGLIGMLGVLGLARAVELDLLLRDDTRYDAEAWMQANVPSGADIEVYQDRPHLPRFRGDWRVKKIPIAERSIANLQARDPQFIVLSSASTGSITDVRSADWRTTGTWVQPVEAAVEFHRALTAESLPYRRVAEFRRRPHLFHSKITSLSPTITIYAREARTSDSTHATGLQSSGAVPASLSAPAI